MGEQAVGEPDTEAAVYGVERKRRGQRTDRMRVQARCINGSDTERSMTCCPPETPAINGRIFGFHVLA